ncbi:hypothetical protein EYC84_005557 [Monilinia fructicola]|uniref:Uncharacterized protein n=1 Tax=Monilinia fructicola TaxID=38448 RepID=A0A5M9JXQ1_MONFR|nr:hypothetical protein EYC84_005557 [Monilinia fructicola]
MPTLVELMMRYILERRKRMMKFLAKVHKNRPETPRNKKRAGLRSGNKDYDPLYDGESSPTVVGSTSSRPEDDSDDGTNK